MQKGAVVGSYIGMKGLSQAQEDTLLGEYEVKVVT
jgi:hypothetical protein